MNTLHNTFRYILSITGSIALLMGCTVDSDIRCNDGQTPCPEAFYCGGEWCYPEGTGPGAMDRGADMAPTPDMTVDMARPDMTADMAQPDMAVDMAPLDMAVDMAPLDMAVPDMAAPVPQLMLGPVTPRNRLLSTSPTSSVIATLFGGPDGPYALQVSYLAREPGEFDPQSCRMAVPTARVVNFDEGLAELTITLEDLNNQPNPVRICIVDPAPGGAVLTIDMQVDHDLPDLRVDPFDTNANRTSGILSVAIESDDVERADVRLFDGEDCDNPYADAHPDAFRRIELPDEPQLIAFELTQLELRTPYEVSVLGTDTAGNEVCIPAVFTVNAAPDVRINAIFCEQGTRVDFVLDVIDDEELPPETTINQAETTCGEYTLDDGVVEIECDLDCVIAFEVRDAIGVVNAVIPVDVFNPDAPLFRTPLALSYLPGSPLAKAPVAGAARMTRVNDQTIIVTGKDNFSASMRQWTLGPFGWTSTPSLTLPGIPIVGDLLNRAGIELFLGNISYLDGNLGGTGCSAVVLPDSPYDLSAAMPQSPTACSGPAGNFIRRLWVGELSADNFEDVVGIDNTGRVDLWPGGIDRLRPVVNLHAPVPDELPRPIATDVAVFPQVGRIAIALADNGVRIVDAAGNEDLIIPTAAPADCIAAVDWFANPGSPTIAICQPGGFAIHRWNGMTFDEVAEEFVPVDLGGADIIDILFERINEPSPSALFVDSTGRAGIASINELTLWDTPAPISRIIDLNSASPGFDAALIESNSSQMLWMLSDDSAVGFAHRLIGPDAGVPLISRPIGGADVTGDYVADILFAPVAPQLLLQAGDLKNETWNAHTVGAFQVRSDLFTVIGDFNADGRPEVAGLREANAVAGGGVVLQTGQAEEPDERSAVRFGDSLPITDAAAERPWGLAAGPLRADTVVDLIVVGKDRQLQVYQIDHAIPVEDGGEGRVEEFALVRTIENVEPGEIVIADFNGDPAVIVFEQQPEAFSYKAWSVEGTPLGQGQRPGTLEVIHTAHLQGVRKAFVTIFKPDGDTDLLKVDGPGLSLYYPAQDLQVTDFAIGDLDGDQVADLALATETRGDARDTTVQTLYRLADGQFNERMGEDYVPNPGWIVDAVYIGDFDGDRRADRAAVLTTPEGGRAVVLSGRVAN